MISSKNKEIVTLTNTSLLMHYKKGTDTKLKHMSHIARTCYMIVALCKLHKDDFESKIIIHLLNI